MYIFKTTLLAFVVHFLCQDVQSCTTVETKEDNKLSHVYAYLPEEFEDLYRLNLFVTNEQKQKFETATNHYYGKIDLTSENYSALKNFPLFEILDPSNKRLFLFLGLVGNLPFDILPEKIRALIDESEEIYIQAEGITHLQGDVKRPGALLSEEDNIKDLFETSNLSDSFDFTQLINHYAKKGGLISNDLQPNLFRNCETIEKLLDIFSTDSKKLTFGHFFYILHYLDRFFNINSSISMRGLNANKPVFLLDKPYNCIDSQINLERNKLYNLCDESSYIDAPTYSLMGKIYEHPEYTDEQISNTAKEYVLGHIAGRPTHHEQTDDCNIVENLADKKRQKYLIEKSLIGYIKDLFINKYIEYHLTEYLFEMKKIKIEIEQEIFTTYACDYEKINLDLPARYERWINLLLKNQSESKKIVCVALAYLPDLFNKFKALGYSIRAVTES